MGKALDTFLKGRYAHALVLFEKEIRDNPDDPNLYYYFALSCFHTKNYKKANEVLEHILEKYPGFPEKDRIIKLSILSAIYSKQLDKAEKKIEVYLKKNPNNTTLLTLKAHIWEKKKKYQDAISIYRDILKKNPNHKTSLNNLGYLLLIYKEKLSEDEMKEAVNCLKKAIQLEPNNPAYLDSFGTLLEKIGNKEKAIQALEKAVQLSPGNSELIDHLKKLKKS